MAETSNIARPYARAVFELAQEADDLAGWSARLEGLAAIAADPAVARLAGNPRVSDEQLQAVILDVAKDALAALRGQHEINEQTVNLVKLLVRNGRIGVLPAINRAYAAHRFEAERVVEAQMTTAVAIDMRQREQFTIALQAKLGRKVKLEFAVDRELVGGAVVRAGDRVIDGSVRAQLEQLVAALRA